jgi:hypothetical protein
MRAGWAGYFRMVPDYSIAIEETHGDGNVVVMLGMARGTYVPDGESPRSPNAMVSTGRS